MGYTNDQSYAVILTDGTVLEPGESLPDVDDAPKSPKKKSAKRSTTTAPDEGSLKSEEDES